MQTRCACAAMLGVLNVPSNSSYFHQARLLHMTPHLTGHVVLCTAGGLYLGLGTTVYVKSCSFRDNAATMGGAIMASPGRRGRIHGRLSH